MVRAAVEALSIGSLAGELFHRDPSHDPAISLDLGSSLLVNPRRVLVSPVVLFDAPIRRAHHEANDVWFHPLVFDCLRALSRFFCRVTQ
jgi:hypothetical protein